MIDDIISYLERERAKTAIKAPEGVRILTEYIECLEGIMIKQEPKIADLEARITELEKEVRETEHITKTGVLSLIKAFRQRVITYTPREEFVVPDYLDVERRGR